MGPLASSHTARLLLIMLLGLVLVPHSIMAVADASQSGNLQGVGGEKTETSAGLRIREEGPEYDQIGADRRSEADVTASTFAIRRLAAPRKILGDISPPGMWPTPDGQDDVPPVVDDQLGRSLLTVKASPPPFGTWLAVMHSSQDREDAFLRQALVVDKPYPVIHWALMLDKLKQLGNAINKYSLEIEIRLPEFSRGNAVAPAEYSSENQTERGLEQSLVHTGGSETVDADQAQRSSSWSEMRSSTTPGHSEERMSSLPREDQSEEPKFPSRSLLQGDISPPGMWPDADDDEMQFSESLLLGNEAS